MTMGFADEFNPFNQQAVIKVVGIGGGGGNAVGRMIEAGLKEVEFITINTDAQALKNSPAGVRLQIGEVGLGAGAKPEMGQKAALDERDRVADVLAGADMIFLTAGLGGGTGTGATPIVAEVARETGALTVAIVTLPFKFEGKGRLDNAMKGLSELQKHVDALIVVPNERLAMLSHDNITFLNAFRMADEVLHNGVRAISELITLTGLINLDFADVRTIMKESGRALMGIGTAEGEKRGIRAAQEAIVCPLLDKSTIDGAIGVIVNVKGGSDVGMREVLEAVTTVQKAAHPSANIIFGAVIGEEPSPEMQVTVIAAGFPYEELQVHDRYEDAVTLTLEVQEELPPLSSPQPVVIESLPVHRRKRAAGSALPDPQVEFPFLIDEGGRDTVETPEYTGVGASNELDDDMSIPAFMRRRMKR